MLAQTSGVWTQATSGGLWSNGANWQGGNIATGTGASANFGTLNFTSDQTVHLDLSEIVGSLIFGDTSPSNNWTLDDNGITGNTLTLAVTSGTPTIAVNNEKATVAAVIAGTQGLAFSGAGSLVLTNENTFTGNVSIGSGSTLEVSADSNFGASGNTLVIAGGTLQALGSFTTTRPIQLGPASGGGTIDVVPGAVLTLGGASSLSNNGAANSFTKSDGGTLVLATPATLSGGIALNGGTLLIGTGTTAPFGGNPANSTSPTAGGLTMASGTTLSLAGSLINPGGSNVALASLSGAGTIVAYSPVGSTGAAASAVNLGVGYDNTGTQFSGSFLGNIGLYKWGTGTLTLSGTTAYLSTPVTASPNATNIETAGGAITASAANVLPIGSQLLFSAASTTFNMGGFDQSVAGLSSPAAVNTVSGNGAVSGGNSAATLNLIGGSSLTFSGVISGANLSLAQNGTGNQTLTTAAVLLSGTGYDSFAGATTINAGTLTLDASNATSGANLINPSSALTLAGGTLAVKFRSGSTATNQTFVGTTVGLGASAIAINVNGNTAATSGLALGSITRSGMGATMDFGTPLSIGNITTSTENTSGILGGWATINKGTGWAVNSAASGPGNVAALGSGSYTNDTWTDGNNTTVTNASNNITVADGATTNSLRFGQSASDIVNLGSMSADTANVIESGGILVSPRCRANRRRLPAGFSPPAMTRILIVNQFDTNMAGLLTISSVIVDDFGKAIGLTKSGGGLLVLAASNTFTGGTVLNAGTLNITEDDNLGASGSGLSIGGGATLLVTGGGTIALSARPISLQTNAGGGASATINVNAGVKLTYAGAISDNGTTFGNLTLTGGGVFLFSGNSTYSGNTTLTGGSTLAAGAANILSATTTLFLDAGTTFNLGGFDQSLGGLTSLASGAGAISGGGGSETLTVGGNNGTQAPFSGTITGGGLSLVKTGSGMLAFSPLSTAGWAGYVGGGTITVSGGIFQALANAGNSGSIIPDGTPLAMSNAEVILSSGATTILGALSGSGIVAGNSTGLVVGFNNASTQFAGSLVNTGSLVKIGTGKLTLSGSNGYSGSTTIQQGTLVIGADYNLGTAPAAAATNIVLSTGTLEATASFSLLGTRTIALGSSQATFGPGSGGTIDVDSSQTLAIPGLIVDNAAPNSLAKTDAGTLVLSGANSYSGPTIVSGGNLVAGLTNTIGTTSGLSLASGTSFVLDGNSQSLATISGAGNITNNSNTPATLTINGAAIGTLSGAISERNRRGYRQPVAREIRLRL